MKWNVAYPNDKRRAAQALKAPDPSRRATSWGTTCHWKVKRRLMKKLSLKMRHHVLWVDSLPYLSQLNPSPRVDFGLWMMTTSWPSKVVMLGPRKFISTSNWPSEIAILGPRKFISTSNWLSEIAILGPEWCRNDLELTFNDCHAWSQQGYRDLKLATERQPCLVLSNAAMTTNWPSKIVMLGPPDVTTTSNWLRKAGHAWSWVTR